MNTIMLKSEDNRNILDRSKQLELNDIIKDIIKDNLNEKTNMSDYKRNDDIINGSRLMDLDDIIRNNLEKELRNMKYFHKMDGDCYIGIQTKFVMHDKKKNMFKGTENKITFKSTLIFNDAIEINIDSCELCDKEYEYVLNLSETIELDYCPYYNNAAVKLQKWFKKKLC